MALPILDGNQSATTLSTIFTAGAHIPAHTVVSLGSQAISDIGSAVSGISVSIGGTQSVTGSVSVLNFPATQTIAGTVTANLSSANLNSVTIGVRGVVTSGISDISIDARNQIANAIAVYAEDNLGFPIRVAGADGGDVPVIGDVGVSGTVTASIGVNSNGPVYVADSAFPTNPNHLVAVGGYDSNANELRMIFVDGSGRTIISGTVTAAAPNGSLTTRFGTPTTANTAFATSAVTNANRKYLLIQNVTTGSNVITVGIGFTPTTTQGIQLTAGAGITFESSYIPTGAVYVLSSVTASNFTILEA